MATQIAKIGQWYKAEEGAIFEVVALDDISSSIEIQYIDGEIGEYDIDSWLQDNLQQIAAPEDWTAPYEVEKEQGYAEDSTTTMNLGEDPLQSITYENLFNDL
ncbi:hypothetical protein EDC56_2952 [Sinobacterium caligoides]|uniref:Uncharacterized protein n=1 Tax=Sinobacterium caligoides TaxID=933926 RepID=A0A3N2DKI6_9GAMM|nr:DUF6763 family protein [Sinobacterium caligoides]ROS00306.1 hypothetical protein EDC56_2952 [Sinobacterium caligoides]